MKTKKIALGDFLGVTNAI